MGLIDQGKELVNSLNSDEKGQLNALLFGPIVVVFGVMIVIIGLIMINAIGSQAIPSNAQQSLSTQHGVNTMIAFVPYAGVGVVIGGILLTLVTVFGLGGRR